MNYSKFNEQITRLRSVYGENNFQKEQLRMIWEEVKDFTDEWFKKTVNLMISTMHHAPKVVDFHDQALIERERLGVLEKQERRREAEEFFKSTHHPENQRWMFQTIIKRMNNDLSEEEWQKFTRVIEGKPSE